MVPNPFFLPPLFPRESRQPGRTPRLVISIPVTCEQNVNAFFPVPANCWKPCQIFLLPFCSCDICPACCAYLETGFPPGFAAGVSRGKNYLPRTYALLREWPRVLTRPARGNLLRRDSPRPPSDLFTPPKHPFWRNFFGTFPSAEAGGSSLQMGKPWPLAGCWEKAQQSTRGPGGRNDFLWGTAGFHAVGLRQG